jgi:tetratricopeptide (TPR) repeat protein
MDSQRCRLSELRKHEESIMCYDKALEIDPNYSDAWTSKGIALAKLAKAQEAENCFYKATDTSDIAWKIIRHFDELPDNVRNLLLVHNSKIASEVSRIIADSFNNISEDVRNMLLLKVADNKEAAPSVAWAVVSNFDKLPEDIKNRLLFNLAHNKNTIPTVIRLVKRNFDKLPEDVRNTLSRKLEKANRNNQIDNMTGPSMSANEPIANIVGQVYASTRFTRVMNSMMREELRYIHSAACLLITLQTTKLYVIVITREINLSNSN